VPDIRYIELCTPAPGGGCDAHGPDCATPGKRPVHADWARHWSRERPEGNAGVLCGPETGLLVIDVDTLDAGLQYQDWDLPQTFTVQSGRADRSGYHCYFRWPEGLERVPNRLDGVEIKGPGRQVVAWDSLHASGRRYEKLGGTFAELPAEFVERLRGATAQHGLSGTSDATPAAEARLAEVLEYFPDAEEQHDGNWQARCPAHDDRDPSLVLTASENRLLVHCRAGCAAGEVLDAVGLPVSAMWAGEPLAQKTVTLTKVPLGTADELGTRSRLKELMGARLGETQWVVPDLLPAGLALLAGPPKLGKSWMVLDIAISVAAGRPVLGRSVEQGDVLYLALEDNWRRLQGRSRILLGDTPPPAGLELWTRAGKLGGDLVAEVEEWIDGQEAPRLVIIDTLGRVQGTSAWVDSKDGGYADAVEALAELQTLASERHVALVVITHTKKGGWSDGADPLEAVLGSQGYAGTADAVLVLKRERGSAAGELFVTGREVDEELTEAVWFDRDSCRWLVGDADYPTLADEILDFLERKDKRGEYENGWTLTGEGVALALHRRRAEVEEELARLEAGGQVLSKPRPGRGRPGKLWGPICLPQSLSNSVPNSVRP
jgi:hypothetical protein